MIKIIKKIAESATAVTIITLLIIIQILGMDINLLGVYMFGELVGRNNLPKVFIASLCITLIIDAINMHILGTWALSFFCIAVIIEIVLRKIKIRNELENYRMRNHIIITCTIAGGALAQTNMRQWLTGQIISIEQSVGIVVASIVYVMLRNMNNKKETLEYIKKI